ELMRTAADIEQRKAGQRCRRIECRSVRIRRRIEARFDGVELGLQRGLALLAGNAQATLAAEIIGRLLESLLQRNAPVRFGTQTLLEIGDQSIHRRLLGPRILWFRVLWRVGDATREQCAQLANADLARGEAVAKLCLLAPQLFLESDILRLKCA